MQLDNHIILNILSIILWGPTLLDMYLRTANFKQNVLAILGAFQK